MLAGTICTATHKLEAPPYMHAARLGLVGRRSKRCRCWKSQALFKKLDIT